jgi:hypothetical protein
MRFSSNTIPVLKFMVVVMAFCAVGASIRRSHLLRCICRRAEKWVGDIRVYFCIFCVVVVCMHISWLAFGVGCTVGTFFKIFKTLACSFSISI